MTIISLLETENVKRIKAVRIVPKGSVVEITGMNEQGKTSVMDSIAWALGGDRLVQDIPIREGENEAHITVVIADREGQPKFKVLRTFRRKVGGGVSSTLSIFNAQGKKQDRPQDLLNSMIGSVMFDPMAFLEMSPEKQFGQLQRLIPDFDFAGFDKAQKKDFEDRRDVNRDADRARKAAETIEIPLDAPEGEPLDPLMKLMSEASEKNSKRAEIVAQMESRRREAVDLQKRSDDALAEAEKLQQRVGELMSESLQWAEDSARIHREYAQTVIPDVVGIADIQSRIEAARAASTFEDQRKRKAELEAEYEKFAAESCALTMAMDTRAKAREKAIAAANLPIKGLTLGDGTVLLDDLPLAQASDGRQLMIALAISAAMNPELRIAWIRDGSRLDTKKFQEMAKYAADRNIQVWIETVESGREGAIVIEDGEVKA